ncbi:F0F1 ATP synthase subunit epsilon [Periweissella cryptocerci]|uniref:ATP synthase epsilon chain n=1 Tax=Periweissella cryptocerci TaxID=2506420 RepID=A0A4P6YVG1_9LACO|nr:F0F1 ATP synthase subunit epsilon [Periweissella cryptocerci]QBO36733.1 F0F1 ATP synthase subunit epsilon [Periweissella cryptocerci]
MAEHTLAISIVTPDGVVYSRDDAKMVVLKTMGGTIGVMANHQPIVSALQIDEADVEMPDGTKDVIAVNGGFAEFSSNTMSIVADSAETPDQIDVARAEAARERAQKHISHATEVHDADEMARAQVALKRSMNRLRATGGTGGFK